MSTTSLDYPEEYTKGMVHFFGRDFIVTPDVLIPRLETECLVKRARTRIRENNIKVVVDIGSGSGIIGTSVADLVDEVIFLDISGAALEVTKKNFRTHFPDKKAQFNISDLLSDFPTSYFLPPLSPLLFLTNLPYIKDADWKNMSDDTHFEPRLALFGGEKTGFELYEKLFEEFHSLSISSASCIFEFGFDQREFAEEILKKYPNWKYNFFTDYAGIERFGEIMI